MKILFGGGFGQRMTRCHIHHPHHYQDLKPTKGKDELEDEQAGEVSQDVTLLNLEGGGGDVLLFAMVTLVMVVFGSDGGDDGDIGKDVDIDDDVGDDCGVGGWWWYR